MVLFICQTATSDIPLMVATQSTDNSFRDFDDRVYITLKSLSLYLLHLHLSHFKQKPHLAAGLPPTLFHQQNWILNQYHILRQLCNSEYENTNVSLVNSSMAVNDLIAKYVGWIIFHLSASNWKVVFDHLSTKINLIATHPELAPDSIDLQFMSRDCRG